MTRGCDAGKTGRKAGRTCRQQRRALDRRRVCPAGRHSRRRVILRQLEPAEASPEAGPESSPARGRIQPGRLPARNPRVRRRSDPERSHQGSDRPGVGLPGFHGVRMVDKARPDHSGNERVVSGGDDGDEERRRRRVGRRRRRENEGETRNLLTPETGEQNRLVTLWFPNGDVTTQWSFIPAASCDVIVITSCFLTKPFHFLNQKTSHY